MSQEIKTQKQFDELMAASSSKPVFLKLHMDGCGHCIAMAEAWKEMAKKVPANVAVAAIESSVLRTIQGPHAKLVSGVTGFPTLLFIKGTKSTPYNGERDAESLLAFVKKELAMKGGKRAKRTRTKRTIKHHSTAKKHKYRTAKKHKHRTAKRRHH